MIYVLVAIILILTAIMVSLSISFSRTKRDHAQKLDALQHAVSQLTMRNHKQVGQLQLSGELRGTLNKARETIDKDLIAVQHGLVETLAKNNLIH